MSSSHDANNTLEPADSIAHVDTSDMAEAAEDDDSTDRPRLSPAELRARLEAEAPGHEVAIAATSEVRPSPYSGVWSPAAFAGVLRTMRTAAVRRLDLSSDGYVVPKALKRHLEARDRTCLFPGCPRLAAKCDKDHLIPWPRGRTEEPNLLDECDHHHHH